MKHIENIAYILLIFGMFSYGRGYAGEKRTAAKRTVEQNPNAESRPLDSTENPYGRDEKPYYETGGMYKVAKSSLRPNFIKLSPRTEQTATKNEPLSDMEKAEENSLPSLYKKSELGYIPLGSLLFLLFALLLLSVGIPSSIFRRKSAQQNQTILKQADELSAAEAMIRQLSERAKDYDEKKDKNPREVVLHHFEILRKAALLGIYNKENAIIIKTVNKIVYAEEEITWESICNTVNKIYDNLFERIEKTYPSLDASEYRICCLTCMGFNCSEIGLFIGLSTNTVHTKRSQIRKKLNMEAKGNIREFLMEKFM